MEAEPQSAAVEKRKEEMGISKNQYMEDMAENWLNVKVDGGTEKLAARGEVTSAVSASRNPEMEAERWSAEIAPAMKVVNEEVSPIEQESKNIEEVAAGKDAPSIEEEGGFVL